tara:strand:+ start:7846 stop:8580 length:735 start_codon:yes stop_codon:yes gene_type:complete
MTETLLELAQKYHSDKCANGASKYGYIPYYEKHFKPIKNDQLNILEIGVRAVRGYGPSSLKMWKDYFPNSQIYGIDIDPENEGYDEDRIKIFIGDQGDKVFLGDVIDEVGKFDIIIDDGSHINTLTIKSWEALFDRALSAGGLYIIEDLANSYLNLESFNLRQTWEGMKHIPSDVSFNNERSVMADFLDSRIKKMDMCCTRWYKETGIPEITSMIFYPMMCFMTKVYSGYDLGTQGFKQTENIK